MKRTILVALATTVALTAGSAHARTIKTGALKFTALPCALACSYNFAEVDGTAGQRFDACRYPSPAESFDDIVLKAPTGARQLIVLVNPTVEWDLFICSKPSKGNNGSLIAENLNNFFECQVTCSERVQLKITAGRSYVLRAYNVWDPADLTGRYWFNT